MVVECFLLSWYLKLEAYKNWNLGQIKIPQIEGSSLQLPRFHKLFSSLLSPVEYSIFYH